MRNYAGTIGTYADSAFFSGTCFAIERVGPGEFMVSPGDIDPPGNVRAVITQILGEEYPWYPVVGNHEEETSNDMEYLRSYDLEQNGETPPNIVNTGPPGAEETCYSFDYENTHFIVINQYYDGDEDDALDGDVCDELFNWLAADLAATPLDHRIVFGHEPAFPQRDEFSGRRRHVGDSLDKYAANRDRFWDLLVSEGVGAYFCGHTHNYSSHYMDGVWQIDVGHCRGAGDEGAPSTFVMVHVDSDRILFDTYRDVHDGVYDYMDIVKSGCVSAPSVVTLVPSGSTWSYLDDGSDQETGWREPDFDDTEWYSGAAPLGYGDGDEETLVSYGPDRYEKYITTYLRNSFTIKDTDQILSLVALLQRDDGAVLYLNGSEAARSNMPDGEPGFRTRAVYVASGAEETEYLTFHLDRSLLVRGKNVIAVEVHQVSEISSDLSFDLELIAFAEDTTDADGDGIPAGREGDGDRDGDGLRNDEDFDPVGFIYDEETGEILAGGSVEVSGPGNVTLFHDGSEGWYQFTVDNGGLYTIAFTPPAWHEQSDACSPEEGSFVWGEGMGLTVLGNGEDGSSGSLVSSACTPFYFSLEIPAGDPVLIGNNIPCRSLLPDSTLLASFSAVQSEWDVELVWETIEETGAVRFHVFRMSDADSAWIPLCDSALAGTADGSGASYTLLDRLDRSGDIRYRLEIFDDGELQSVHETGISDYRAVPLKYALATVPNPFSGSAEIRYDLPEECSFTLAIYDVRGRLIHTINEGEKPLGSYSARWDGVNEGGESVPAGVYFCRFRSGIRMMREKMVLIR